MAIKFTCPCGQKLSAAEELSGKRVRCPKCHRAVSAPNPLLYHTEMDEIPADEADTRQLPTIETD